MSNLRYTYTFGFETIPRLIISSFVYITTMKYKLFKLNVCHNGFMVKQKIVGYSYNFLTFRPRVPIAVAGRRVGSTEKVGSLVIVRIFMEP